MTADRIEVSHKELDEFCRRNSIRRLALFGSVLTERFSDSSDVDVLVEFEPGARVGYIREWPAWNVSFRGCLVAAKSTCGHQAS